MDTKQLITFLTFVKEESFNRTAQKLNYSVSTLAAHIKSLENEFGVELVSNHGRKSVLTDAGRAFVPYARQIMEQYQQASVTLSGFGQISGEFTIAVSEMVGSSPLPNAFPRFAKENPGISLSVRTASTSGCKEMVIAKTVDVAILQDFAPSEHENVISVPLYDEPVVLVAAPQHPLAKKEVILPRDLRYQTLIFPRKAYMEYPPIKKILEDSKISASDNMFLESGRLLRHALKEMRCIAFMPLRSVQEDLRENALRILPWKGEGVAMTVYAMYAKQSLALPAVQELIAFIQNTACWQE